MKKETMTLIENYLDDDLKDMLRSDSEKVEERLLKKSETQWLDEAAEKHKSPLIPLFSAMKKAEEKPSDSAEDEVTDQAIRAHEFTGLFTRGLLRQKSNRKLSVGGFFKLHYISKMASLQMKNVKEQTDHRVSVNPSNLLKDMGKVTDPLLDPQYKAAYIRYQADLVEATQESFDKAEPQLASLGKKASKRSGIGVLFALIIWIVGALFIWNTFGHVWNWAFDFIDHVFFPLILFFWVIPILYALIVGFFFLWVGTEISELFCKDADKKLKIKITELKADAEHSLRNTESAKILEEADCNIPRGFRDYAGHIALSAIAALTGETKIRQLASKADDDSTWLTRKYKKYSGEDKPYANSVASLLYDTIPDETDVFAAFTLLCRRKELAEGYDGGGGFSGDNFLSEFMDVEKDDIRIRGKLLFCFVNYALNTLKEGENKNKKRPGFAALLQEIHTGNYYLKVDNDNYSRIHTYIRSNKMLIDWHLGT